MTRLPLYAHDPHWKEFFPDTLERAFLAEMIQEEWIDSGDTQIHLDIYHTDEQAPTVIYCHGLSSCGRMMAHLVRPLYDKGYNVICPDLVGFGMTIHRHGSGTVDQYIQNLLDTIAYAKQRFTGPRYLTGISMGGALSYYAATHGADVKAIACFCLMDFSAVRSHRQSALHHLLKPIFAAAAKLIPHVYIPMKHFLSLDDLCTDPAVVDLFKSNPLATKHYTIEALYSLVTSSPKIPFEAFDRLPVMVLHAKDDQLLPERLSKENYMKIAGEKEYVSLKNCGHIPLSDQAISNYVGALDRWFRKYR